MDLGSVFARAEGSVSPDRIPRRDGARRRYVVEEASVLVVGDDQRALGPDLRCAERLVDSLDEGFALLDPTDRMLRLAPEEGGLRRVVPGMSVVGFDVVVGPVHPVSQPRRVLLEIRLEVVDRVEETGERG